MHELTEAEMIALVRFYSNTKNATTRFTDADILRELDYGMAKYWNLLTKRMTWLYVQTHEITVVANTTTYGVIDHGRTISVEIQTGDTWKAIHRADLFAADQRNIAQYSLEYSEFATAFGQSIVLHTRSLPVGKKIRIRYIGPYPRPSADALQDGFDFPSVWEEIPALWAAIRIMAVDQEDFSLLKTLLDDAIERMNQECDNLDVYQGIKTQGMKPDAFYGYGQREHEVG